MSSCQSLYHSFFCSVLLRGSRHFYPYRITPEQTSSTGKNKIIIRYSKILKVYSTTINKNLSINKFVKAKLHIKQAG